MRAPPCPPCAAAEYSRPEVAAVAGQAVRDLAQLADPVLAVLADPKADAEARASAVSKLGRLGMLSGRELLALLAAMKDPQADVRRDAASALGELGPEAAAQSVPALMAALKDADEHVSGVAADALATWARPAARRSSRPLAAQDRVLRRQAANALYWMHSAAAPAVGPLVAALDDKVPEVRAQAAATLGQIGPAAAPAIPRLVALLDNPDKETRKWAADALADIDPTSVIVVQALRQAVRDPDSDVRWWTVCAFNYRRPAPQEVAPS